ncbi:hypothetical protein HMPREF2606_01370 [Neisseria sp. HMSC070H10]|nr:hypothetical protein HMPREF2606_01370 [Neisseria sp. HMSC070H10]
MQLSRLAGLFLRTKYPSKLSPHFANIYRMVLQGLPMFVRQEIAEFVLGGMGVVNEGAHIEILKNSN